jgi:predicted SAM-dependent methyltransferase
MIKLHLGCGWRNFGSDWIHIDGGDYTHLVSHDIINLPYEDNSVDLIYASHVFEYFDRVEACIVLQSWRRVLKPTGVLRLAVPDFEAMAKLYNDGTIILEQLLGPVFGKMSMGSETIYHKTTYDFTSLQKLLENNGFEEIMLYDWRNTDHALHDDHSQAYIPHMDKDNGTLISLNVECQKK